MFLALITFIVLCMGSNMLGKENWENREKHTET